MLICQREISALEASFDENKGDVSACGAGSSSSLYDNETNDGDEEKQKSVDIQVTPCLKIVY